MHDLRLVLIFSAVRRRNKISKSLGLRRSASSEHFIEFRITGVSASLVVLPFVNSGGSVFREFEGTILLSYMYSLTLYICIVFHVFSYS